MIKLVWEQDIFAEELTLIQSDSVRKWTTDCLNKFNHAFYTMGASSSGKYHPKVSLGLGGLVKHTKICVHFAVELRRIHWWNWEQDTFDLILSALLLHDGGKYMGENTTISMKDHPLRVIPLLDTVEGISNRQRTTIVDCIQSHMGQWDNEGELPVPIGLETVEFFVHLCDYLASRKILDDYIAGGELG